MVERLRCRFGAGGTAGVSQPARVLAARSCWSSNPSGEAAPAAAAPGQRGRRDGTFVSLPKYAHRFCTLVCAANCLLIVM